MSHPKEMAELMSEYNPVKHAVQKSQDSKDFHIKYPMFGFVKSNGVRVVYPQPIQLALFLQGEKPNFAL